MARSNFLDRFRPAGSPGPAAASGVPAADAVGPETELAAVFAALTPDLDQAHGVVEAAQRQAEQELAEAKTAADDVVAHARAESPGVRRLAYEAVLAEAARDDSRLEDEAAARAAQLQQAGMERLPEAVRRILDRVFDQAATG